WLRLWLLAILIAVRGLGVDGFVAIVVHVVVIAIVALLLLRHLRLRSHDDAVVVLGVLEVVLRHHTVTGALRVARQCRVFLGDLLRGSPDVHVGPVALIAARQRIGALAATIVVIVVAIVIAAASAHAPVLLWPHSYLFMLRMISVGAATLRARFTFHVGDQPQESRHRHVNSVPVHIVCRPLPARVLASSTHECRCSLGNRIDNSTPCFVSSGRRKLSSISLLAKRFFSLRHALFARRTQALWSPRQGRAPRR